MTAKSSYEQRPRITEEQIKKGLELFNQVLDFRLKEKGDRAFASKHEVLGIITEEYQELIEAVKNNDKENFEEELFDVAVAAIFGYICSKWNALQW